MGKIIAINKVLGLIRWPFALLAVLVILPFVLLCAIMFTDPQYLADWWHENHRYGVVPWLLKWPR